MRRERSLTSLSAALDKTLRRSEIEDRVKEALILEHWSEIVGEANARATRADSIKEGTLFVSVKSSGWAQELGFLKQDIIRKLNESVGKRIVKEIQFKARTLKKPAATTDTTPATALDSVVLTEDDKKALGELADGVEDENLRERVLRMMETERKLEKLRESQGWKPCPRCGTLHEGTQAICPICEMETTKQ